MAKARRSHRPRRCVYSSRDAPLWSTTLRASTPPAASTPTGASLGRACVKAIGILINRVLKACAASRRPAPPARRHKVPAHATRHRWRLMPAHVLRHETPLHRAIHPSTDAAPRATTQHELVVASGSRVALKLSGPQSGGPSKHERGLTTARGPPRIPRLPLAHCPSPRWSLLARTLLRAAAKPRTCSPHENLL